MATIDLRDAYYVVPIAESSRKHLRWIFNKETFEFSCLPFGLNVAPYVFTKIMKPVGTHLRELVHISVIYLDDLLLIGNSIEDCVSDINTMIKLLQELWFVVNYNKSILELSRRCKFLGFYLDTKKMIIELPETKRTFIQAAIKKFSTLVSCKLREFASFWGSLGGCSKIRLDLYEKPRGDLGREKNLSNNIREDIKWWETHISWIINPIRNYEFQLEIFSDASLTGWGISCNTGKSHGHWN